VVSGCGYVSIIAKKKKICERMGWKEKVDEKLTFDGKLVGGRAVFAL